MNQLVKLWRSLKRPQQISLIVIPAVVLLAAWYGLKMKHEGDFHVIYSGLALEDANAVTQKLHEASIEYRLEQGGAAIAVPSARVADARLAIAGAGLPRSGRIGFELFDRSNLGSSDFAEQVNYRRALEGELERTIATLSDVDQARVHLTFARDSVFLDDKRPSKATVVLRLKRSAPLSPANVTAIANLVASAVDGLTPESVAVIDSNGRLLNRPQDSADSGAQLAEANLDYKRQVESELLNKVNAALEPLLGAGRYRAGVNVDCDFSSSEENEESFDSAKSVIVSSQSTEESSATGLSGGTPGAASNLPKPTAQPVRPAVGASGISRKSENLAWQPGRTVRRTVQPRGMIRRISAAVLVDQTVRWEGVGPKAKRILVPPSPETMKGIRDVVASVMGVNDQRGDVVTVDSLPFENTLSAEPPPAPPAASGGKKNQQQMVLSLNNPLVIAAPVVLLLAGAGFFFFRRKRKAITAKAQAEITSAAERAKLNAGEAEKQLQQQLSDNEAQQALLETEAISRIKLPTNSRKTEVLSKHIRETSHKDPAATANVLRSWIADGDDRRAT